ncbi:hypothetical protein [Chamaesiphon sp. VAR_48_metabat_403]|uniref:hypothetical protein n=1 Tax=Chamaesiphon sp. VAR_48_metabat_403 TaxID=2964700 RepID=UPI00286E0CFB|nr:hypothetical protein [Chamaesiphon sp. VAR_48_metabat_403]
MKIIIVILVPILLGIVVGSNLLPTMAIVIFNQPTMTLPIGVWLIIAIGLGLLSSITIRILLEIDRRVKDRQTRQVRSRSVGAADEDVFTYTSPDRSSATKNVDPIVRDEIPPSAKTSPFRSYRTKLTERFTPKPSVQTNFDDRDDDWEDRSTENRQLDWEDSPLPRPQNVRSSSNKSTFETAAPVDRQSQRIEPDRYAQTDEDRQLSTSREVYDADFRLIQPPYKQPLETEFDDEPDSADLDDPDLDEADDNIPSVKPTSSNRSSPPNDLDDEDWGFDFDDRDLPNRAN